MLYKILMITIPEMYHRKPYIVRCHCIVYQMYQVKINKHQCGSTTIVISTTKFRIIFQNSFNTEKLSVLIKSKFQPDLFL